MIARFFFIFGVENEQNRGFECMWNPFKRNKQKQANQLENHSNKELSFQTKEPLDVQFVQHFNKGGGHFLYCENQQKALENLQKIIRHEGVQNIQCFDDNLQNYLDSLSFKPNPTTPAYNLLKCEFLIAFDGSIMVTNHQTKGRKLLDLENRYIILAHPAQIKQNSSEALTAIKRNHQNIPSYISCLKLNEFGLQEEESKTKLIYLLLVEDLA